MAEKSAACMALWQSNEEMALDQDYARGNVWRLGIAQALAGANATIVYATGSVIGHVMAPDPALAGS